VTPLNDPQLPPLEVKNQLSLLMDQHGINGVLLGLNEIFLGHEENRVRDLGRQLEHARRGYLSQIMMALDIERLTS
jgi:hypothetical protein